MQAASGFQKLSRAWYGLRVNEPGGYARAALEDEDALPGLGQPVGRDRPAEPGADDDRVEVAVRHVRQP